MDNCNLDGKIEHMYFADFRDIPNVKIIRMKGHSPTEFTTRRMAAQRLLGELRAEYANTTPSCVVISQIEACINGLSSGEHGRNIIDDVIYEY